MIMECKLAYKKLSGRPSVDPNSALVVWKSILLQPAPRTGAGKNLHNISIIDRAYTKYTRMVVVGELQRNPKVVNSGKPQYG